ncbi:hypothetical protein KAW18_18720 [candidate division WOR-3 bacterium]|nr:hypothetical protein [candidate division WOR-3 bacterium]
MFTWTETPMVEMWHHLRYLRSPSNVYNLLSGKITSNRKEKYAESKELHQRSYEISACIRQADEYYQSAETVGLATQPLLQFYGAQALAKAVILSNDSDICLSNLKYHGLSTRASTAHAQYQEKLRMYSNDTSSWEVEKEFAVTNKGVFPSLCRSIGDHVPKNGEVLIFKDLVRIIPDIARVFHRHYGESSHCFYLSIEPKMGGNGYFEVHFSKSEDREEIRRSFPEFESNFEVVTTETVYSFRSTKKLKELPTFGVVEKGTVAGKYFVRPHDCGIHKSLSVLYASMFILSNVVRYKPSFWMRVIEGEHSGSASIVEALCNLAKRRLPNDALEAIWQEDFIYATPAYLS